MSNNEGMKIQIKILVWQKQCDHNCPVTNLSKGSNYSDLIHK